MSAKKFKSGDLFLFEVDGHVHAAKIKRFITESLFELSDDYSTPKFR